MKPILVLSGCLAFGALGLGALGLAYGLGTAPASAPVAAAAAVAPVPPPTAPPAPAVADNGPRVPVVAATVDPAPRPPQAYREFFVDGPYIALTFDDGPSPEQTPKLLAMLKERGVKATFFVLGTMAAAHPELLQRIVADGHEIGNHSWNHPQFTRISLAAVDKQITDTSDVVFAATGKRPVYLRPPYGSMKPSLRDYIEQKHGMSLIYWSVDPMDWKNRNSQAVYDEIMKQVKPGAIVLAHDIHATTVAAMPKVLDDLIAKGYKFGTLSELVALNKAMPPKLVAAAPAKPQKKAQKPQGQKPKPASATPAQPGSPRPAAAPNRNTRSAGLF